jgi:hypothetical protein
MPRYRGGPAYHRAAHRPRHPSANRELAERSNEGLLTEDERAEYDSYVEGAEILSLIKLKANRYLIVHGGN